MFAIKNYGLLWEREYLPRARVRGYLYGCAEGAGKVDFHWQRGVYVLHDKDSLPVYVGSTGCSKSSPSLLTLLRKHHQDRSPNNWVYFSWFGVCEVDGNGEISRAYDSSKGICGNITDALNDIEGTLILAMRPMLNNQDPRFEGVQNFCQLIDEDVSVEA